MRGGVEEGDVWVGGSRGRREVAYIVGVRGGEVEERKGAGEGECGRGRFERFNPPSTRWDQIRPDISLFLMGL